MNAMAPPPQRKCRKNKSDSELFCFSEGQIAARDAVRSIIEGEADVALITGCMGSGKTRLIERLIEPLDENTLCAHIAAGSLVNLDSDQMVTEVIRAFGVTTDADDLGTFVAEREAESRLVLLVVDNAQILNQTTLETVVNLADPLYQDDHSLSLILVGRLELEQKLSTGSGIPLLPLQALRANLGSFTQSETIEFMTSKWQDGKPFSSSQFSRSAMEQIHYYTRGNPKAILALGNLANTLARQQDGANVTDVWVHAAVKSPAWVLYAEASPVLHTVPELGSGDAGESATAFVFYLGAKVQEVTLDRQYTYIGKDGRNTIEVDGKRVSDLHACIELKGDTFCLHKLSGIHALHVNALPISHHTTLNDGDIIRVGTYRVLFLRQASKRLSTEHSRPVTRPPDLKSVPSATATATATAVEPVLQKEEKPDRKRVTDNENASVDLLDDEYGTLEFSKEDEISEEILFKNMIDLPSSDEIDLTDLIESDIGQPGELQLVSDSEVWDTVLLDENIVQADSIKYPPTGEMSLPPLPEEPIQAEKNNTADVEMLVFNGPETGSSEILAATVSDPATEHKDEREGRSTVWMAAAAVSAVLLAGTVLLMNRDNEGVAPSAQLSEATRVADQTRGHQAGAELDTAATVFADKSALSDVALVPANLSTRRESAGAESIARPSAAMDDSQAVSEPMGGISVFQSVPIVELEPEVFRIERSKSRGDALGDAIDALLKKGERELQNLQLTRPTHQNAHATFLQVLDQDSGNLQAQAGLRQVAQKYLQLAQVKNRRGEVDRSLSLIERGLRVVPAHQGLLALQQDIQQSAIDEATPAVFLSELRATDGVISSDEVVSFEPGYELATVSEPAEVEWVQEAAAVESEAVVFEAPQVFTSAEVLPVVRHSTSTRAEIAPGRAERSYQSAERLLDEGDSRASLVMIYRGLKADPNHAGLLSLKQKANDHLFDKLRAE